MKIKSRQINNSDMKSHVKLKNISERDLFIKNLFEFFSEQYNMQQYTMAPNVIKKYLRDNVKNPIKILHNLIQHPLQYYFSTVIHESNTGQDQNLNKAFEIYQKSANKGNLLGQCNLGNCYMSEMWVPKNQIKGFHWYLNSAIGNIFHENSCTGNIIASNCLGYSFENGEGIMKNLKLAFEWYMRSANSGYSIAQCNVGNCYFFEIGTTQDNKKAFEWYRRAAENDNTFGQLQAGLFLLDEIGRPKDIIKGIYYLNKAKENGGIDATDKNSSLIQKKTKIS
ncbi:8822_t:CDS:2 [Diversispora eburnea]|uniref:8822_t:CDS:1 n=1 Tax=Diversispora eburnea TaxID=1213867 RepID=A0A9N8VVP3_9GLOM|nr:8822_t:CDS:2 [Diversispora eburnea]